MADESYYWYKSHGICVKCKKNNASPNRIMCDECREKWNAIRREKSKNPEYKNWKKQYNKEHKEKMLEMGFAPCVVNRFIRDIKPATNTGSKTEKDGKGMKKTIVGQ